MRINRETLREDEKFRATARRECENVGAATRDGRTGRQTRQMDVRKAFQFDLASRLNGERRLKD